MNLKSHSKSTVDSSGILIKLGMHMSFVQFNLVPRMSIFTCYELCRINMQDNETRLHIIQQMIAVLLNLAKAESNNRSNILILASLSPFVYGRNTKTC